MTIENQEKTIIVEDIYPNEKIIPITNLEGYLKQIYELSESLESNVGNNLRFFYRGESSAHKNSIPSIFRRKSYFNNEKKITFDYMRSSSNELLSEKTNFNIISKIQHHDGLTRMLDVTSNALTALFFACTPESDANQIGTIQIFLGLDDGYDSVHQKLSNTLVEFFTKNIYKSRKYRSLRIHSVNPDRIKDRIEKKLETSNIKNFLSDTVEVLATIALMTVEEQQQLMDVALESILNEVDILDAEMENPVVRKFYGEIKRKTPAFENRIDPLDLFIPRFVIPSQNHERITRQDGCFLVFGLPVSEGTVMDTVNRVEFQLDDDFHKDVSNYVSSVIDKYRLHQRSKPVRFVIKGNDVKQELLKQLDLLGINSGKIYADLDHTSAYLKSHYYE